VGAGPSDGCPVHSYRAELYGILATITSLVALEHDPSVPTTQSINVYSDNKAAVNTVLDHQESRVINPLAAEYDLLMAIYTEWRKLKAFSSNLQWIKGHQNPETVAQSEKIGVTLNNLVDKACNDYMDLYSSEDTTQFFPLLLFVSRGSGS